MLVQWMQVRQRNTEVFGDSAEEWTREGRAKGRKQRGGIGAGGGGGIKREERNRKGGRVRQWK